MMDEQELERQKFLGEWDRQSCAEFEAWLDEVNAQDRAADVAYFGTDHWDDERHESAPCTCYYTDVDVVENRYCEAHGPKERF